MRIIAKRSLVECWEKYPKAKLGLSIWEERIDYATCANHTEIKTIFPTADYILNPHFKHLTVFNNNGNEFRLVVDIFFNTGHVFVKWFGKHADYDRVNFRTIDNSGFLLC